MAARRDASGLCREPQGESAASVRQGGEQSREGADRRPSSRVTLAGCTEERETAHLGEGWREGEAAGVSAQLSLGAVWRSVQRESAAVRRSEGCSAQDSKVGEEENVL